MYFNFNYCMTNEISNHRYYPKREALSDYLFHYNRYTEMINFYNDNDIYSVQKDFIHNKENAMIMFICHAYYNFPIITASDIKKFNTEIYAKHEDLKSFSKIELFTHYLRYGVKEDRVIS